MRRGPKPKEYDLEMAGRWYAAVCHPKATCVVCEAKRELQGHHAIPKSWLEKEIRWLRLSNGQRNAVLWDVRNGLPLCVTCHQRHTDWVRTISRSKLPAQVFEFARDVDRMLGTEAATMRLERDYPA